MALSTHQFGNSGEGQDTDELDFRELVAFSIRQCRLILGTGAFALACSLFALWQITPLYTATALVMIDPSMQRLTDAGHVASTPPVDSGIVGSEVEVLRSDAVSRRAIQDSGASEFDIVGEPTALERLFRDLSNRHNASLSPQDEQTLLVINLMRRTTISRRGMTFAIAIDVANASPQGAALLANALADAYLAEQVESKIEIARRAEDTIAGHVADLAADLRAIEGQLDDMLLAAAAANLGQHEGVSTEQNAAVAAMLQQLAQERQSLFAERAALTRALRTPSLPHTFAWNPATDSRLDMLLVHRAAIVARLEAIGGHDSDERETLLAQQAATTEQVNAALAQRRTVLDDRLSSLDTATSTARQQLRAFLRPDDMSASLAMTLIRMQEEAETTRSMYRAAVERLKQAQLLTEAPSPNARILSRAMPPLESSYPPRLFVAAFALLLGLGCGAGLAVLRESMLAGIEDAESVERSTGLPMVAAVPAVSRFDASMPQDLVITQPLSPYTDAIRRLAHSLEPMHRQDQGLSVLFCSTNANEGKSSLALSYAMLTASMGKRTLLIDADLRQAAVFDRLHWEMDPTHTQQSRLLFDGVVPDILAGHAIRDPQTGMEILGNSHPYSGATDALLEGQSFAALIETCRQSYDVVVIDSPPVQESVDARLIVPNADAIVVAMRYRSTTVAALRSTLRELDRPAGPHIFGVLTFTVGPQLL